ncbi:MAG: sporulation protein YqfD [Bacillota bacterium]|nr:sporulation protein YqfD [Bacillota bacterium]
MERGGLWPGYLLISIKGRGIARLLNLTARNGIYFWDLRYKGNVVTVKIKPRDFKKLRPLIRKTACKVKILGKKGTPFIIIHGWRRKGLVLGIVLFCFFFYFLSLFVWNISIEGNIDVETEKIIAVLDKHEVKNGIRKKEIDLSEVERALLLEIEELKWVGVSIRGVYLNIQIVERLMEPPIEENMDLFAVKDGLITDILVLAGKAVVEPGDTVQRGQLLISGKMTVPDDYVEYAGDVEPEMKDIETKARGMVEALVWYESYAEVPLYHVYKRKTGNLSNSISLLAGDKIFRIWGPESSPYRNYELEKIKRTLAWRNLRLPVELVNNNYWEYEVEIRPVSPHQALEEARNQALAKANAQLPRGAAIKKRFVNEYYFFELGTVGCRVMIETLEDIAVSQIFF